MSSLVPLPANSPLSAASVTDISAGRPLPWRRRSAIRWLAWLLLAAIAVPLAYFEIPREVARWYLAAGYEDRAAGNKPLGYQRLERALAWSPQEAALFLERAQWREEDDDFEAALLDYDEADELEPDRFRTLFARSLLYERMGRPEDARADWQAIDRLSQNRSLSAGELQAAIDAVNADRQAGRLKQADQRMELLIGWSHHDPELVRERIRWQMDAKDYAAALAGCNGLVNEEGDDYDDLNLRSQVLQHLGRHAEAIEDWEAIDKLSKRDRPTSAEVLNGLAYARAVGNLQLEKGLQEIKEALRTAPDNAAMLDTRGFLLYRQGKYDAALKDMDPAVAGMEANRDRLLKFSDAQLRMISTNLSPAEIRQREALGVAVVRYHRALVLEKLGRKEDAQRDLDRARELSGREPDETLF